MKDKRIKMECPFCHCPAEHIQIKSINVGCYRVECPECGATFNSWTNKQEAINKWNRR